MGRPRCPMPAFRLAIPNWTNFGLGDSDARSIHLCYKGEGTRLRRGLRFEVPSDFLLTLYVESLAM